MRRTVEPRLPHLPRFSPTRLSLYLFCPRAYFFYYHRQLRWGGMTPGHAFGGNLHRALQHLHLRGGPSAVPVEELLAELRRCWSRAGFASEEEAELHLAEGQELLRRYHALAASSTRETLWAERTVQHRYAEFVLFGKIDRLDRLPDGSLEVVDYKSGRTSVSEEEVRASLALAIYQLLVARANPGVPVRAAIVALRTGEAASILRSDEELAGVEREVQDVVLRILADEAMQPAPGERCRACVYPSVCPAGRDWLRRAPRPGSATPE